MSESDVFVMGAAIEALRINLETMELLRGYGVLTAFPGIVGVFEVTSKVTATAIELIQAHVLVGFNERA